jgi:hypothetical protein
MSRGLYSRADGGTVQSNRDETGRTRWVDLRSAVARTGLTREQIVWAMASGEVRYSTSLTDQDGLPRLDLEDVELLASLLFETEPGSDGPA